MAVTLFCMMNVKYIPTLTIAGSDSSGGAGVQADLKTMSALGCYAMSVITAVTAQNTQGVLEVQPVSAEMVALQLQAVFEDIPPLAIKTGMLFNTTIIETVATALKQVDIPLVVDPVMVATSGDRLLSKEAEEVLKQRLLPLSTLITPNLMEAEVLSGVKIDSQSALYEAGQYLLALGTKAVLIKGGHTVDTEATDYLFTDKGVTTFSKSRIDTMNTHGTGCTLSAAITAYIARGLSLEKAIEWGKEYLSEALNSGKRVAIGKGHGPVDHFFQPQSSIKR